MWSFRSVRALGLALVVGAMLAGCGSEVALEKQSAASALAQPNYAGLSVYTLIDDGFSIGVPSGWTAITAEDAYSESIDAIVESSPRLAKFRDLFAGRDSPFKLFASEYDPDACICSTIMVIAMRLDKTWRARDFEAVDSQAPGRSRSRGRSRRSRVPRRLPARAFASRCGRRSPAPTSR